MRELRCLYFDDDPKERPRIKGWIEDQWRELNNRVPITVVTVDSTDSAKELLMNSKDPFHVFVADIFVGRGKDRHPLGLIAIHDAHRDYPNLAIVALSIGSGGYEQRALDQGADEYVSKHYLIEQPEKNLLAVKMLGALRKHEVEPIQAEDDILAYDENELELATLVETIGRSNIISFALRACGISFCERINLTFVRAGLSGASVIGAHCEFDEIHEGVKTPQTKSVLLKISRDAELLNSELTKDVSKFPHGLFIRFIQADTHTSRSVPFRSGNWFAIASELQNESRTLVEWLQTDGANVSEALKSIFLDSDRGLKRVYAEVGRKDDERPNVALHKTMSLSRKARLRQAMRDLEELASEYGRDIFKADLISEFIVSVAICGLNEERVPKGSSYCFSHGDLHGRNVLVSSTERASLIDPANIGNLPWPIDIARLSVDLIVSAWDAGKSSHEWGKMPEWIDISTSLVRDELGGLGSGTSPSNVNVYSALTWLRANLGDIHTIDDTKPEWQFRLALAIEFMRASYRLDLPSPKRVLGLVSACAALRETKNAFEG